jgi:hypothetical protein
MCQIIIHIQVSHLLGCLQHDSSCKLKTIPERFQRDGMRETHRTTAGSAKRSWWMKKMRRLTKSGKHEQAHATIQLQFSHVTMSRHHISVV